ncbi:MAG: CvpA family protein [Erysipelotrichaceae bacterium]|nr:CvpA family protein [Erysipelotrichaceae bacterium]
MIKKLKLTTLFLWVIGWAVAYFILLPPINPGSMAFWGFFTPALLGPLFLTVQWNSLKGGWKNGKAILPLGILIILVAVILLGQFVVSPVFNARGWTERIEVTTSDFETDITEVDFNNLPLLDKASSQKVGDRVVGQIADLVSQFSVSDEYSLINYRGSIVRVTPLEHNGFYKYLSNRSGTAGYVIVDTTTGEAKMVRTSEGLKYLQSAYMFHDLDRHLRLRYPFEIFGETSFEIDEDGVPYWIVQTISYSWINVMKGVSGVIACNAITGETQKYSVKDVPTWIDNVYDAKLVIDEIDSWGKYQNGYFNSKFAQKNVVQTTDGYTYITKHDDVYMYTGITSVSNDESNIGFVMVNLRTHKASYYEVPGAEEFSAMDSAQGMVQEKGYTSTFPLLINLNGRPTYLLSLKDDAGLVKMYAFVDVVNYQKVSVSDAAEGIVKASNNYLKLFDGETIIDDDQYRSAQITIKRVSTVVDDGNTFYYLLDTDGNKYVLPASVDYSVAPFVAEGESYIIRYYNDGTINRITEITEAQNTPSVEETNQETEQAGA